MGKETDFMNKEKLSQLRELMRAKGVEALVSVKADNLFYLSGFECSMGYGIITQTRQIIAADSRYDEWARVCLPEWEVICISPTYTVYDVLRSLSVKTVGLEEGYISYQDHNIFTQSLPGVQFCDISPLIQEVRAVKTSEELDCLRMAGRITDKVFTYFLDYVQVGMRESDVADELCAVMKKFGASRPLFMTLISGSKTSMPHGSTNDKVIEKGDFVTLDMGSVYRNYGSDMTRTVVMGKAADEQKRIYDIVLQAHLLAAEKTKEGMTGQQADAFARDYIKKMGYGDAFLHQLGHGVGLNLSDGPRLGYVKAGENILRRNMVFTIEPGIYLPGFGGVRIEDTYVMTETGCQSLMASSKELFELD